VVSRRFTKWRRHTCLSTAMNPHAERRNAIAESGLNLLKGHTRHNRHRHAGTHGCRHDAHVRTRGEARGARGWSGEACAARVEVARAMAAGEGSAG
jgi:hypothetical protein